MFCKSLSGKTGIFIVWAFLFGSICCGDIPEMVVLPGGTFQMGDHHGGSASAPVHEVYLDSFEISRYEITNAQYCEFLNFPEILETVVVSGDWVSVWGVDCTQVRGWTSMSNLTYNGEVFSPAAGMEDAAIANVTWFGAVFYCMWLSTSNGMEYCYGGLDMDCDYSKDGYRLASEAEWEYAARGGQYSPYYRYTWGDVADGSKANWFTFPGGPVAVGSYLPNGYGLYDMIGNAYEWCNDRYDSQYYNNSPRENPPGPDGGTDRIVRGGDYFTMAQDCTIASRGSIFPLLQSGGIRVVRRVIPEPIVVEITGPTDQNTFATDELSVQLIGTASSNVTSVNWTNDRGCEGVCGGTEEWTCLVELFPGENLVTVTAGDLSGKTEEVSINIIRRASTISGKVTSYVDSWKHYVGAKVYLFRKLHNGWNIEDDRVSVGGVSSWQTDRQGKYRIEDVPLNVDAYEVGVSILEQTLGRRGDMELRRWKTAPEKTDWDGNFHIYEGFNLTAGYRSIVTDHPNTRPVRVLVTWGYQVTEELKAVVRRALKTWQDVKDNNGLSYVEWTEDATESYDVGYTFVCDSIWADYLNLRQGTNWKATTILDNTTIIDALIDPIKDVLFDPFITVFKTESELRTTYGEEWVDSYENSLFESLHGPSNLERAWYYALPKRNLRVGLDVETIALHEIGHALGLDHAEKDPYTTMRPDLIKVGNNHQQFDRTLSYADVLGLAILAGDKPQGVSAADQEIFVPDAGFDDHAVSPGGWAYIGNDYTGPWQHGEGDAWIDNGYWGAGVGLPALSGENKLYGNNGVGDYVYQILDETFIGGATYTLSVWTGIAWSGYADHWALYITGEDHKTHLAEFIGNAPVRSWGQVSVTYTATAADAGKKIGIKMCGDTYVTFDDVTLSYNYPVIAANPNPANEPSFLNYYTRVEPNVTPRAPGYDLPLKLNNVSNLDDHGSRLNIDNLLPLIEQYGFGITPYHLDPNENDRDDFAKAYQFLEDKDIPLFITSDALLHVYHIIFDYSLMAIEESQFISKIQQLTELLLSDAEQNYMSYAGDLKEAALLNMAFLSVALQLLDPQADVPSQVTDIVTRELNKIEAHNGFSDSEIFKYEEDYSQYIPRGHYTRSESLQRYFKAMLWYGRMAFLLKGGPNALISIDDAKIQTLQAVLLSLSFGARPTISSLWQEMYTTTGFFVGFADDLTPYDYLGVLTSLFAESTLPEDLLEPDNLLALKRELALLPSPRIYGGTGNVIADPNDPLEELLNETKGMRLMGQRFVPDSYLFQNLVYPQVRAYLGGPIQLPFTGAAVATGLARGYPRGLDVMALLGSEQARAILVGAGDTNYVDYWNQFATLESEFLAINENDWHKNVYWSWLRSLKSLVQDHPEGYPNFCRTQAWQTKSLHTALASWTELRHDTILYAKQSYTPMGFAPPPPPPPPGYVEPVPEFWARLLEMVRMTHTGLQDLGVLSDSVETMLILLDEKVDRLLEISIKELEGTPLNTDDKNLIRHFGGFLENLLKQYDTNNPLIEIDLETSTVLVADVHTCSPESRVLEEAVGRLDLLVVACPNTDGSVFLAAGPVLSYYEFKQPMHQRLTDQSWKSKLDTNAPLRPTWYQPLFKNGSQ
jgi:formylglycine-generating enzyme required for sulfatase activity